jgi:hypothetical protein
VHFPQTLLLGHQDQPGITRILHEKKQAITGTADQRGVLCQLWVQYERFHENASG